MIFCKLVILMMPTRRNNRAIIRALGIEAVFVCLGIIRRSGCTPAPAAGRFHSDGDSSKISVLSTLSTERFFRTAPAR